MIKKIVTMLLVVCLIPIQVLAAASFKTEVWSDDEKTYSQIHTLINSEREFKGNAASILGASEKIGGLFSPNVTFTTQFKTSSAGFQSLFYIGEKTNSFEDASNKYIVLYMNSGKRIGLEAKGINSGYIHFYVDLPQNFNNNTWHTLSLEMVDGESTAFIMDGVEYNPVFAANSVGMPNGKNPKFVRDASFTANLFSLGGAQRGDRIDWLFNGSMNHTSFITDTYEDGTPAPNLNYSNMIFTDEHTGKDISEHLDYIRSLNKGTLSFRLRRDQAIHNELQHLLTIGNSESATSYSSIYMKGNKIGFQFNNGNSTIASGEHEVELLHNDTHWYTITMTFDQANVTVYVNDQKAFTLPCESFLNKTADANSVTLGGNRSNSGQSGFTGYMDRFQLYNSVLKESYIIQSLNRSTASERIELITEPRPLPAREDAFRSANDHRMFASVSANTLRNPGLTGDPAIMGDAQGFRIPSLLTAVTPDQSDKDVILAFADKGNDSADWGNVDVALRRSLDNGKTWSEKVHTMISLPPRDAPQQFDDWGSAFYIDPLTVQAENGDIVVMVDMFPESKGLHAANWLENGTGYKQVDGKNYLVLYDGDSKVGKGSMQNLGNEYTVREDGWIYDSHNQKLNYYIPQRHSEEFAYETMGDMYYAVGEPDYLTTPPPYVPQDPTGAPEGSNDIYVGNIYLSYNKPAFDADHPVFVQKRLVGPAQEGNRYSKYVDYETDPAPLRATVTSYLWVTRSSDFGATWSQPYDITPQVKLGSDSAFLGVGPGTGLVLQHQSDARKNGRILMPLYRLGTATAIYSDDHGYTWERADTNGNAYINNIDEAQLIELYDGTVMSFGRQTGKGKTPVSISKDGGETWSEQSTTDLISVRVQKSIITYPIDSDTDTDANEAADSRFNYAAGMQKGKQYVIASHATGNSPADASRTNGAVSLGEVQEDGTILWIASRTLRIEPNPYANTNGAENFFGYSSLAVLENGNIGVLFEPQPNNYIAYAEFNLEWILNGEQEGIIYEPNIVRRHVVKVEQPKWTNLSLSIAKCVDGEAAIAEGDTLTFTATFNEAVFVAGEATLDFELNGRSLQADYFHGSGTNTLIFSYQAGDGDVEDGETVVSVIPRIHASTDGVVEGLRNETLLNSHDTPVQLYPDVSANYRNDLIALIASAIQITDEYLYTEDSWAALEQNKTWSQSVIDDSSSSIITIQSAWHALTAAIDNLTRKAVDPVLVTSITVKGTADANRITEKGGILQLLATVLPADADNQSVTWSVMNGTGRATIDPNGLLTAVGNGMVTAIAIANDGTGITGELEITISGQEAYLATTLTGPDSTRQGDQFSVKYGLGDVDQNIYAHYIVLNYNANLFEFVKAASLIDGISILESETKTSGEIKLIMVSLGEGAAITADAEIAELVFRAKEVGETVTGVISIVDATVGEEQGGETAAALSSHSIELIAKKPGIPGDFNGDEKVSIGDLAMITAHYGKDKTSPDWHTISKYDMNGDDKIDIFDLAAVAKLIVGD